MATSYIYYYNGIAQRSSGRGTYKFGLYDPEVSRVIGLSGTKAGALKDRNYYLRIARNNLKAAEKRQDAEAIATALREAAHWEAMRAVEVEVKEID